MSLKTLTGIFGIALYLFLTPALLFAQNDAKYVVITRAHFNMKSDLTLDDWKATEKEYFDKVTAKNDLIVGANVLMHFYTGDNSEVLIVTTYRTWDDIDKASAKDDELAKAAWPDEPKRQAFFKKKDAFYTSEHSDEIRMILPNTKPLTATTEHIYAVTTRRLAFPADAKPNELRDLMDEYVKNVTHKNQYIKGYYPQRHLWGADGREYVASSVYATLDDMEKAADENEKLVKAHWPDEAKRKEFFAKFDRFFEPWHGDALYKHVPELRKVPVVVK
jgi:hypothetical protein